MSRRALCRWCIALAVFFAAYFALRTSRAAMTALWYGAVLPAEQWLGRLCGRLTLSVGEVLILTAVFCAILWLANVPRRIIAARAVTDPSAAIVAARKATSLECCSTFCPYE